MFFSSPPCLPPQRGERSEIDTAVLHIWCWFALHFEARPSCSKRTTLSHLQQSDRHAAEDSKSGYFTQIDFFLFCIATMGSNLQQSGATSSPMITTSSKSKRCTIYPEEWSATDDYKFRASGDNSHRGSSNNLVR